MLSIMVRTIWTESVLTPRRPLKTRKFSSVDWNRKLLMRMSVNTSKLSLERSTPLTGKFNIASIWLQSMVIDLTIFKVAETRKTPNLENRSLSWSWKKRALQVSLVTKRAFMILGAICDQKWHQIDDKRVECKLAVGKCDSFSHWLFGYGWLKTWLNVNACRWDFRNMYPAGELAMCILNHL